MRIEELVLTVEQMQHLKELGLEVKDTAMAWVNAIVGHNFVAPISLIFHDDYTPTLTLQEILELLPESIGKCTLYTAFHHNDHCPSMMWYAQDYFMNNGETLHYLELGSPLQTAYHMLCWVIENGYLKR